MNRENYFFSTSLIASGAELPLTSKPAEDKMVDDHEEEEEVEVRKPPGEKLPNKKFKKQKLKNIESYAPLSQPQTSPSPSSNSSSSLSSLVKPEVSDMSSNIGEDCYKVFLRLLRASLDSNCESSK
jgi:hypothetical protein